MSEIGLVTYRHALQPFFERAGRGAASVCSDEDRGVDGGGCSCGVKCDILGGI
jgi:hypothetical protein